jgi:hypothetical protein
MGSDTMDNKGVSNNDNGIGSGNAKEHGNGMDQDSHMPGGGGQDPETDSRNGNDNASGEENGVGGSDHSSGPIMDGTEDGGSGK